MTFDIHGGQSLIAWNDQFRRPQQLKLGTNCALGKASVFAQGSGRRERPASVRTGVVGQAKQDVPGAGIGKGHARDL
ncbi:hypothetical protein BKM30_02350 [Pseudomonas syringae pv. syringae]|nr:hypothetical protein BKM27_02350 [Pseudomonas syringae pv. syringae]POR81898.1 hypothetical protein BKM30_02350 [Pseudomonas syringae pv. syringae]